VFCLLLNREFTFGVHVVPVRRLLTIFYEIDPPKILIPADGFWAPPLVTNLTVPSWASEMQVRMKEDRYSSSYTFFQFWIFPVALPARSPPPRPCVTFFLGFVCHAHSFQSSRKHVEAWRVASIARRLLPAPQTSCFPLGVSVMSWWFSLLHPIVSPPIP